MSILLAAHTIVVREPGTAKNDIVGIAILSLSVGVVVFAVTATPILVYLYRRTA